MQDFSFNSELQMTVTDLIATSHYWNLNGTNVDKENLR